MDTSSSEPEATEGPMVHTKWCTEPGGMAWKNALTAPSSVASTVEVLTCNGRSWSKRWEAGRERGTAGRGRAVEGVPR